MTGNKNDVQERADSLEVLGYTSEVAWRRHLLNTGSDPCDALIRAKQYAADAMRHALEEMTTK